MTRAIIARALTASEIRAVVAPFAENIASAIDSASRWSDDYAVVAPAAVAFVESRPGLMLAIAAAGTDAAANDIARITPLHRSVLFREIVTRTVDALGLEGIDAAVVDLIAPRTALATGTRH